MPQFQRGDMWSAYNRANLFLVTTNSTLKRNNALVMGRGIARQARDRFPGLDLAFGQAIAGRCGHLGRYRLLVSPQWPNAKIGAFQVKTHYGQSAELALIKESAAALAEWCALHPHQTAHLNFPGIGNGGLLHEEVAPLLATLPHQVTIWEYAPPEMVANRFLPDIQDATAMQESRSRFFALPDDILLKPAARERHIFASAFYRGAAWMQARSQPPPAAKEAA